jgi:hypothetical protein
MNTKPFYSLLVIAVIIALFGAAIFTPQIAYAKDGTGGGTGTLTASGDGLAAVRGKGTMTVSGNGILWIRDHKGDAQIKVTGEGVRREMANGWVRYIGFKGEATITGSKVTIALAGYDITLKAEGIGKFLLRGNGTYQTGDQQGVWSAEARVITIQ